MSISLSGWYKNHEPKSEMLWCDAAHSQIESLEYIGDQCINAPLVIGTHTSKSILLPVVEFRVGDVVLTMRGNFHNYKVSVSSPVTVDFLNLFSPTKEIHPAYCEGFPPNRIYGSYVHDPRQFTLELGTSTRCGASCGCCSTGSKQARINPQNRGA